MSENMSEDMSEAMSQRMSLLNGLYWTPGAYKAPEDWRSHRYNRYISLAKQLYIFQILVPRRISSELSSPSCPRQILAQRMSEFVTNM